MAEKKYSCKMEVKFYESDFSKSPLQSEIISVVYLGEYLHYKNKTMEAYKTPRLILNIDHETKTILVNSNNRKGAEPSISRSELFLLDSIISNNFKLVTIDSNNETTRVRISPRSKVHQLRSADFVFKTQSLEPISIEVFYESTMEELFGLNKPGKEHLEVNIKSKPRLTIDYLYFNYNPGFDENEFAFSKYLNTSQKPFKTGPLAKNYKIFDYSQPNRIKK